MRLVLGRICSSTPKITTSIHTRPKQVSGRKAAAGTDAAHLLFNWQLAFRSESTLLMLLLSL